MFLARAVVLVIVFVLGRFVFYTDIAAHIPRGLNDLVDDVQQIVETSASEISRAPGPRRPLSIEVSQPARAVPELSLALVPVPEATSPPVRPMASRSRETQRPEQPAGQSSRDVVAGPGGIGRRRPSCRLDRHRTRVPGVVSLPPGDQRDEAELVVRRRACGRRPSMPIGDLPLGTTSPRLATGRHARRGRARADRTRSGGSRTTPRQDVCITVRSVDCRDWTTGRGAVAGVGLLAPIGRLYARLALRPRPNRTRSSRCRCLGTLLLIIQGSALVMGIVLADHHVGGTSSSPHRAGPSGDFAIASRPSRATSSTLAGSFNRMSAAASSICCTCSAEKRLDDELRIRARDPELAVPVETPRLAGLGVARPFANRAEVGGGYYRFLHDRPAAARVLIADVSGRALGRAVHGRAEGADARAEPRQPLPRKLLIEVNRLRLLTSTQLHHDDLRGARFGSPDVGVPRAP
jgi:hypothetical protein